MVFSLTNKSDRKDGMPIWVRFKTTEVCTITTPEGGFIDKFEQEVWRAVKLDYLLDTVNIGNASQIEIYPGDKEPEHVPLSDKEELTTGSTAEQTIQSEPAITEREEIAAAIVDIEIMRGLADRAIKCGYDSKDQKKVLGSLMKRINIAKEKLLNVVPENERKKPLESDLTTLQSGNDK